MRRLSPALLLLLTSCGGVTAPVAVAGGPPEMEVGGATLTLEIEPDPRRRVSDEALVAWTRRAARMVDAFCGGFPVPELEVRIGGGGRLGWGNHRNGRHVFAVAGRGVSATDLERDWVLVHEMLHTAFPDLARRHLWMREGLSTYLQTLVRARAGILEPEEVWSRYRARMELGRPRAGDRGLDRTHTWGRTYWGGALFWMVVDVELRRRTNGERSIRDVIRGVLAEGGNARVRWPIERVLEVADEATGTEVVSETYARMARAPGDVDLDALWARLGVDEDAFGGIVLRDDAPWADVRRQIEAERPRLARTLPAIPDTVSYARRAR